MSLIRSSALVACVCCIACSILSVIAPLGRMRKTMRLIFGAFLVCSMLVPIVGVFTIEKINLPMESDYTYHSDYRDSYNELVINQTADNLVLAAYDLLLSSGVQADNIELALKKTDTNSIYISRIIIYINEQDADKTEEIKRVISLNMSEEPVVIVSENKT